MLIPLNNEGLERIHERYCSDYGLNEKDISYIIRYWNRKLGESFEFKHDHLLRLDKVPLLLRGFMLPVSVQICLDGYERGCRFVR